LTSLVLMIYFSYQLVALEGGKVPTYTIAQVAEELQVSIITVKRWIKAEKINVVRLGYHTVRITDEELNRIKREGLK